MDMKTVLIGYLITDAICAGVIGVLYVQNRKQYQGLGFWGADFVMQFAALVLIVMRGVVPDFTSMVVGNGLVIGGAILLYRGLEKFTGRRGAQWHNAILFILFVSVHSYFAIVSPNLTARNINFALGLFMICAQCAWLLLHSVDGKLRPITRDAGLVFAAFCLVNAGQIVVDLAIPSGDNLFHSDLYDTSAVMVYQMLFIALTFSLFLMVNRRLLQDLQEDMNTRQRAEEALRNSEQQYRQMFTEHSAIKLLIDRISGAIVQANPAAANFYGYPVEALETMNIEQINTLPPEAIHATMQDTLQQRRNYFNFQHRLASGEMRNVEVHSAPIKVGGRELLYSIVHDITERKHAEEERNRLARLVDASPASITVHDKDGKFLYANQKTFDLHGYSREEFMALNLHQLDAPESAQLIEERVHEIMERGEASFEAHHFKRDGSTLPLQVHVRRSKWDNQAVIESIAMDITERKMTEELIHLRLRILEYANDHSIEELLQKALDEICLFTNSSIGFYHFIEPDQKTISLQAWSTRTLKEFCRAEGKGMHYDIDQAGVWVDCVHQRKPVIHNDYASLPHRKGLPPDHAELKRELVVPILREGNVVSILGIGNKPSHYNEKDSEYVSYVADIVWTIVERKQVAEALQQAVETLHTQLVEIHALKETLQEQAIRDPLTNLHNRRYLDETLEHEVARAKRENYPLSIMMIDIDYFKNFNDIYGHSAGDEVLKSISRLLVDSVRQGDIACRYGGEEFLIVMVGAHEADVERRAEAIRTDFSRMQIRSDKTEFSATISIGVAFYPRHGAEIQQVIGASDAAMYQAKQAGRNRIHVWQAGE